MSAPPGPPAACLVCRKQRGEVLVPGGAIHRDDLVFAAHSLIPEGETTAYLGYVLVETTRHAPGLADLTDAEGQALGLTAARLSRAIVASERAEHVYAFVLGHAAPHFHMHLVPRYPDTPREYWGARIDEWPDAPRGGVAEIAGVCERLRSHLEGI